MLYTNVMKLPAILTYFDMLCFGMNTHMPAVTMGIIKSQNMSIYSLNSLKTSVSMVSKVSLILYT